MPDCELRQRDAIFGTLLQEQDREDHALQQHTEKSLPKSLSLGSKSTASSDDRGQTSFPPEVQLLDEALKNTKWLHLVHEDENIHPEGLSLDELRKSLPAHVFKKDLYRSLRWLVFDLTIVFVALAGLKTLYRNEIPILDPAHVLASYAYGRAELEWSTSWALYLLVTTARLSAYVLLSGLGGFFMWSNFVVGHDCGHGSFSENRQLNFLFGNLTHGAILVPFQSWARSHRLHHMYHNHIEKDYSFPWSHDPQFDNQHVEFLAKYPAVPAALYPIFGYAFYLLWPQQYGGVDGSHFFPKVFDGCRLWETVDKEELAKCWISVGVVACYLTFYLGWFFASPAEFAALYLPCWFFFCFNLYTVTFLQHHSPETRIYDDTTWKYATAAFETVDRSYGKYWDLFHHHISDCHVIHHIFFTRIPHYNLEAATEGLKRYLEKKDLGHLYAFEDTPDFFVKVFQYMYSYSTRAKLVTKETKYFQ